MTYRLENPQLEVVIRPEIGGKIARLFDRVHGREWLWKNPLLPYRPPHYGATYVREHDSGGFDECFPAIAEGPYPTKPWQGTVIPDHGELWGLPWVGEVAEREAKLVVEGRRFPYRFERTATLAADAPELTLSYRVRNLAPQPFPFIWSAHPLLSIRPGMRLLLPEGSPLMVYGASKPELGERGTSLRWPHHQGHDLSVIPEAREGIALKLCGPSPERGWVGLHDPETHTTLRLDYDPQEIPHLGLWLNYGGWTPFEDQPAYFNLGLEPCIGMGDDLGFAMEQFQAYGQIPAHGAVEWKLTLRLIEETLP